MVLRSSTNVGTVNTPQNGIQTHSSDHYEKKKKNSKFRVFFPVGCTALDVAHREVHELTQRVDELKKKQKDAEQRRDQAQQAFDVVQHEFTVARRAFSVAQDVVSDAIAAHRAAVGAMALAAADQRLAAAKEERDAAKEERDAAKKERDDAKQDHNVADNRLAAENAALDGMRAQLVRANEQLHAEQIRASTTSPPEALLAFLSHGITADNVRSESDYLRLHRVLDFNDMSIATDELRRRYAAWNSTPNNEHQYVSVDDIVDAAKMLCTRVRAKLNAFSVAQEVRALLSSDDGGEANSEWLKNCKIAVRNAADAPAARSPDAPAAPAAPALSPQLRQSLLYELASCLDVLEDLSARRVEIEGVNEATLRGRIARVTSFTVERIAVRDESYMSQADRTRMAQSQSQSNHSGAVRWDADRRPDEAVKNGTDAFFYVSEVKCNGSSEGVTNDRCRLVHFALTTFANLLNRPNGVQQRSHALVFSMMVVNNCLDLYVMLPFGFASYVRFKLANIKLTALRSRDAVIDYVCTMLAIRESIEHSRGSETFFDLRGDGGDDNSSLLVRSLVAGNAVQNDGSVAQTPVSPPSQATPTRGSAPRSTNAQLERDLRSGEVVSARVSDDQGCYIVLSDKFAYKVLVATGEHARAQIERERKVHECVSRGAPDAVMPLVSVFHMALPAYMDRCGPFSGRDATVLVMRRGSVLEWSTMEPAQLAERGEQLLAALVRLGECGVVHLDIKPGNLVLHDDRVRLIDFGCAATFGLFDGQTSLISRRGTRGFVAPEIRYGDGHVSATPAADVYSAGVTLALAESVVAHCEPLRQLLDRMQTTRVFNRPTAQTALAQWRTVVIPALRNNVAVAAAEAPLSDVLAQTKRAASNRSSQKCGDADKENFAALAV